MSRTFSYSRFLLVTLLVVLVAAFAVAIYAQGPDNGEPSAANPADPAQLAIQEVELQLQDPAVTGATAANNGEPERQPGTVTDAIEVEAVDYAGREPGLATFFKRWAAETFVAYDSTNTWAYNGGGCFHRTGGTSWWDKDLQIPDGAEIDYLRVYYYDDDPTYDPEAILFQFDNVGGNTQIASAEGTGTPGYSSAGSDFFSHFVDNTNYSYVLRIDFNGGTGSSLQICAVRIRYQFNLSTLSLPLILNHESQ